MRIPIPRVRWLVWLPVMLAGLLVTGGTVLAAEFADDEVYRLAEGEVVTDDLYVTGREVIIDGTVQGDLIAAGAYVEVNGTVTGDAMIAGAGINISGEVQDDVRVAGAGVDISGTIGDDLLVSGGAAGAAFPIGERSITPGIRTADSMQVGGDAMIGGGTGFIGGSIAEDLQAAMGQITLAARVGGDARLEFGSIEVLDTASVDGTLRYVSDERVEDIEIVAPNVAFAETQDNPVLAITGWLIRTLLILAGFVLLGWLLLRFTPGVLTRPLRAIEGNPTRTALTGLLATIVFIFLPIVSALLVFVMVLFWGALPGIVLGIFLFVSLTLIWILSPLVTGFWLGKRLALATDRRMGNELMLLIGIALLVFLGRLPVLGWLIYLLSFIFALGALLIATRSREVSC